MADKLQYYTSAADNLDAAAVETDPSVATPKNVKNSYLYKDAETKDLKVGTMPIHTGTRIKIDPKTSTKENDSYTIPEGYHDGTGKVYTGALSEYTPGNALPEDIVNNKIVWVNGERVVGTLDVEQAETVGTATAEDIVEGKTAWVNKQKITGVIPKLPRKDKTLLAGESYVIPYGVSTGTSTVTGASLASQTPGTATDNKILQGQTAWVNGEKITGTFNFEEEMKEILGNTNVTQSQVLDGKLFYSSVYGKVMSGRMTDHSGEPTRTIPIGQKFAIPTGYYDGYSYITTPTLTDATQGTAKANQLLANKTAWVNGEKITGTMAYNDAAVTELDANVTYTIPEGYHTGNGKVKAKSIADQTAGTATPANILSSKTAWVNGEKVTGTMVNHPMSSVEIDPGETYYIPEGYHTGTGTVWTKSLEKQTVGDAIPSNLVNGKTAWVNGEKIVGSMNLIEPEVTIISAGERYDIAEGYHDGTGRVRAKALSEETPGTATAEDIITNKTAWVNGEKITGNMILSGTAAMDDVIAGKSFYNIDAKTKLTGTLALTGTATEDDVLVGTSFYSTDLKRKLTGSLELTGTAVAQTVLTGSSFYNTDAKTKIDGAMPNIGQVYIELGNDQTYVVPRGYHDGTGLVKALGLAPATEGTATPEDLSVGKTAWVNGEKITGTMELEGTASPDKVVSGYTFYTDNPSQKITGTMQIAPRQIIELRPGEEFYIPAGYQDGQNKIFTASLPDLTEGTAVPEHLVENETAWVNGEKITGTMEQQVINKVRITAGNQVKLPAGYYPDGFMIYALVPEVLDLTGTDAYYLDGALHPESAGYVDEPNSTLVITAEIIR